MRNITPQNLRKIRRHDRIARGVIVLGGLTIIVSVIAILVLIVGVTMPLLRSGKAQEVGRVAWPDAVRSDDVLGVGLQVTMGELLGRHPAAGHPPSATLQAVECHTGETLVRQAGRSPTREVRSRYSLLWSDGTVSLVEAAAKAEFDAQGRRSTTYGVQPLANFPTEGPTASAAVARRVNRGSDAAPVGVATCVRLLPDNRLAVTRQTASRNLRGRETTKSEDHVIETADVGRITALTLDREGSALYAGTENGRIARWQLDDAGEPSGREILTAFQDHRAVTTLAMVLGDVSLAVGDAKGELTTWFPVRRDDESKLTRIHTLAAHRGPVREILPSTRNKSLLSLGDDGTANLDHTTSQRHLLTLNGDGPSLNWIGQSPAGDAVIGADGSGLVVWSLDVPHPEVSWNTLFGKVWYEGYDQPSYTWQSTGTHDAEPKLSLVPLLFGTLKGTLYAMAFAVPLALFAAAYTAHFTTPAFKRTIKPVVEIMAAVPSVVIGFLAALWLAPIFHRGILAVFLCLLTVPVVFIAFMLLWQAVRRFDWAKRAESGYEFLVLVPVVVAGVALAVWLAGSLEPSLFADCNGNFKQWLSQVLDVRCDPRNSVIIAFALGFAVISIIFSIAEDSLSTVPHTLTASSRALGASRWQTLWRVVLPSASPGIFAGIMIGLGRAVGETMIVLMATGNTPVLDWSPLNGMRTLSANIAVEIIEAPKSETLYRVLFLCAVQRATGGGRGGGNTPPRRAGGGSAAAGRAGPTPGGSD